MCVKNVFVGVKRKKFVNVNESAESSSNEKKEVINASLMFDLGDFGAPAL